MRLREDPRDSNLCHADAFLLRELFHPVTPKCASAARQDLRRCENAPRDNVDGSLVLVPADEPVNAAPLGLGADGAGEEAPRERGPRNRPDPEQLQRREHLAFFLTVDEAVVVLHGDERREVVRDRVVCVCESVSKGCAPSGLLGGTHSASGGLDDGKAAVSSDISDDEKAVAHIGAKQELMPI